MTTRIKFGMILAFDELLLERSVTKAAERLDITQAAISNCVAHMHRIFKNDILVPDGNKC